MQLKPISLGIFFSPQVNLQADFACIFSRFNLLRSFYADTVDDAT